MGERQAANRPSRLRLISGLAVAAALIAGGGINAIAMSTGNPMVLEALAPYSGAANSIATELVVRTSQAKPDMAKLREKAVSSLKREPLDFRAARSIALTKMMSGEKQEARHLFRIVARNTLREPITHVWLMGDAFENRRYGEFLRESEIVMRGQPETAASVFTMLATLIDEGKVTEAIAKKVAAKPEWRAGFFDTFGETSKNSDAAYAFYRRLQALGAPASASEQRVWLLHELGRTDAHTLVARWRALRTEPLAPKERLLRNPGFEGSASPQPFDWALYFPEGSFAEISASPSGSGKSLFVEVNGRNDAWVARQILDLAPGRYSLAYRVFPLTDLVRKDLRIGLDCASGRVFSPHVDHAVTGALEQWSANSFDFTVPAGCRAQQITVGIKPEGLTSNLQAYFDDFTIRSLPTEAPSA